MEEKRFSITELAEMLEVHINTIRQWEKQFNIVVPRSKDNQRSRYYTDSEIVIFSKIRDLRQENVSIDNIRRYLNRDMDAIEQEEKALQAMPFSEVNTIDMKELIAGIIIEREEKLKSEFKEELKEELEKQEARIIDKVTEKQFEQIKAENNRLMDYITSLREEDKKKGFLGRLFNR